MNGKVFWKLKGSDSRWIMQSAGGWERLEVAASYLVWEA